jgi:predicted nucleic acid-binding protein
MVLIDSDVFILDLFFPSDPRTGANRRFIERDIAGRATTVFNALEVCGVASFKKSPEEVKRLFYDFHQIYNLDILYPDAPVAPSEALFMGLITGAFDRILSKMNFSDALILSVAESFDATTFVTWNIKHFEGRTPLRVVTPERF